TAVAFLMELANAMQDYLRGGGARDTAWEEAVRTLLKLLNPLAPHACEEMWERLGEKGMLADAPWPVFDPGLAAEPKIVLVVQVAGKLGDRLEVQAGLSEAAAVEAALKSEKVQGALNGGKPSTVVYVPDRLINLVPYLAGLTRARGRAVRCASALPAPGWVGGQRVGTTPRWCGAVGRQKGLLSPGMHSFGDKQVYPGW